MMLARDMLELSDPSELVIVWKIDRAHLLELLSVCEMLVLEMNRAVGQLAIAMVEIRVQGSGEDSMFRAYFALDRKKIDADINANVRMI